MVFPLAVCVFSISSQTFESIGLFLLLGDVCDVFFCCQQDFKRKNKASIGCGNDVEVVC